MTWLQCRITADTMAAAHQDLPGLCTALGCTPQHMRVCQAAHASLPCSCLTGQISRKGEVPVES